MSFAPRESHIEPLTGPLFPERVRDFDRFKTAVSRREPDYVPFAEFVVEKEIKAAVLGSPPKDFADDIRFYHWCGYDYYPVMLSLVQPGRAIGGKKTDSTYSVYPETYTERSWAEMHKGVVSTREEFENYEWPALDTVQIESLDEITNMLPDNMKLAVVLGKLFTGNWLYQGMETFFLNVYDDIEFVEMLYEKIIGLQLAVFDRIIDHPAVAAIWQPDDFSGRQNTLLNPEHFRKYCFPTYKKMGEVCRQVDKPMILHSDGNIWPLMDDLVDCCFDVLHPVEAKAMDIFDVEKRYGDKFALAGNVDLDFPLSRGTPEDVEAEVARLITGLAPGGGYILSAGNSVPEYVPWENYKRLLEAGHRYGRYPIGS